MGFYGVSALLALAAVLFVVWPVLRAKKVESDQEISRSDTVVELYNEHLQELDDQLREGILDEAQHQQLKTELDLALLEDSESQDSLENAPSSSGRSPALVLLLVIAVCVPAAGYLFYQDRGSLADVEIVELREQFFNEQRNSMEAGLPFDSATIDRLYEALETRVQDKPDNLQNQYLFARISAEKGEFGSAIGAYTAILKKEPDAANINAELAQLIFLANGNQLSPEIDTLVNRALSIDPNEATALGLAGISAFQRRSFADAVAFWQRALAQLPPMSQSARSLMAGIEEAQRQLGEAAGGDATSPPALLAKPSTREGEGSQEAADGSASISVAVSLGDQVNASPTDTVFVYARAYQGPRMPLAIARMQVSQLPATVDLNESMAMAPGMSITSVESLELVARISANGDPAPQAGDWQASLGPVTLSSQQVPVVLEINEQIK